MSWHLIPNWRAEINKLWSVRAAILTAIIGEADQILSAWIDHLPPVTYSVLALLILLARIIDQL